ETKLEVEKMKSAYHFEDQDLEQYLTLDKTIAQMKSHLDEMLTDMEADDKAHSDLREELEQGYIHIEALQEKHELFKKRIYNLRSDEIEAKDKLIEINDELNEMKRKLKKNNLPGVPNYIWSFMEQATSKNQQVMRTLEKQPLDIIEVQQALDEAQNTVTHAMEKIDLMIDQARLTEEVIQYANRYRSRNDALRKELEESERLFRKYEYELALEKAAKALEATEPGALKKIESNQ
ncbi:MAG TPA: selenide, water dikinase, partial [Candidatus Avamphibacillus intestinigallinarum]|nr:selenide, water dikinase [Candidatus Avamphibacillus intestinigallinarum]